MSSAGIRLLAHGDESFALPESVPFLTQEPHHHEPDIELGDLEDGRVSGKPSVRAHHTHLDEAEDWPCLECPSPSSNSRWPWRWRISRLRTWSNGKTSGLRTANDGVHATHTHRKHRGKRSRALRCILRLLAISLMLLGALQFLTIAFGAFEAFFPDDLDWVLGSWNNDGQLSKVLTHWPTDFSRDIKPVACHSHNDYWRREPLFSAIRAGCTGVEADIWLFDDEELYVGHSASSLTPNRTLQNLYINPLLDILEKQNPISHFHPSIDCPPNGVFDTAPSQTLVLLIDFKTDGEMLWPFVQSQLEPLRQRNYLTYFNGTFVVEGPLTIVATGNAPFDLLTSNKKYRDVFFDAPLDQMDSVGGAPQLLAASESNSNTTESLSIPPAEAADSSNAGQGHSGHAPVDPSSYDTTNSYYASVSFMRTIGFPWRSRLSQHQLELISAQIRGAHAQGLKVRYWDIPAWPRGLRNYIWRVLVREGVDVLNVDDLKYATQGDWGPKKGGWGGKWWR